MDKMKTLLKSNLNLVLAFVGIIILVIAYLTGYQNLSTLNTDMEAKLKERSEYLEELKGYYSNLSEYRASVVTSRDNITKNLSRLPSGIENEDFLLYLMEVNKETGANLSNISFEDSMPIAEFSTMINGKKTNVTGFRTGTTSTSRMKYDQLKSFIAYIYDENKPITFIESVSATYNGDDASLNTIFNISKYFITYDGSEYKPVKAPDVAIGKKDLFGVK